MAGQRTTIALGGITIEVSLAKTSSEPSAAKWESRTVDLEGRPIDSSLSLADRINASAGESPALAEATAGPEPASPLGERAEQAEALIAGGTGLVSGHPAAPAPAATKTQRGITTDEGDFVDLTDRLAEIDERCKLEAMEIVAAVAANAVPRERVRGSAYVAPVDEVSRRACAMLFDALAGSGRALAVRWTKRTNQALGIIVGSRAHGCLLLLEVEFAANMKAPPKGSLVEAIALSDTEKLAALKFVQAMEGRRADLDGVVDERRSQHAELLAHAKAGTLDAYDEAHDVVDAEIIDEVDAELAALVAASA